MNIAPEIAKSDSLAGLVPRKRDLKSGTLACSQRDAIKGLTVASWLFAFISVPAGGPALETLAVVMFALILIGFSGLFDTLVYRRRPRNLARRFKQMENVKVLMVAILMLLGAFATYFFFDQTVWLTLVAFGYAFALHAMFFFAETTSYEDQIAYGETIEQLFSRIKNSVVQFPDVFSKWVFGATR
ncbi:hypothetical protein [Gordonia sp. NPDC058843]|uniref:hypothetical protein n=1 Tax=Gordonia sp. NPDC058843 TaxID=3346648 RepID=UPI0036AC5F0D